MGKLAIMSVIFRESHHAPTSPRTVDGGFLFCIGLYSFLPKKVHTGKPKCFGVIKVRKQIMFFRHIEAYLILINLIILDNN